MFPFYANILGRYLMEKRFSPLVKREPLVRELHMIHALGQGFCKLGSGGCKRVQWGLRKCLKKNSAKKSDQIKLNK